MQPPKIPLPNSWSEYVRSAVLHVITLAHYAAVYTRSWAADSRIGRIRLRAERDRLAEDLTLLREEARIKDRRWLRTDPQRRRFAPRLSRQRVQERLEPNRSGAE